MFKFILKSLINLSTIWDIVEILSETVMKANVRLLGSFSHAGEKKTSVKVFKPSPFILFADKEKKREILKRFFFCGKPVKVLSDDAQLGDPQTSCLPFHLLCSS